MREGVIWAASCAPVDDHDNIFSSVEDWPWYEKKRNKVSEVRLPVAIPKNPYQDYDVSLRGDGKQQ